MEGPLADESVMDRYSMDRLALSLETVPECIARKGQQGYPMVIAVAQGETAAAA